MGKYNIKELIMVKADWDRTFIGSMTLKEDNSYGGSVLINGGKIVSSADNPDDLGNNLDELCILNLDGNLHGVSGVNMEILGIDYYLS